MLQYPQTKIYNRYTHRNRERNCKHNTKNNYPITREESKRREHSNKTTQKEDNAVLTKSGESGYPCFAPDLKSKCFLLFNTENNFGCMLVIHGFYYTEVCLLYTQSVESFYYQ